MIQNTAKTPRNADSVCRSKSLLEKANSSLTGRYDGMMERLSSHIFVLDPTIKPAGAKYIGFIGNKLMVDPCDNTIDVLTHKRSMRIDSFVLGPRIMGASVSQDLGSTVDMADMFSKLNELKRTLIYHKVYCALRLQRLEKTKKHLNLVGNQLFNLDHRCSNLSCFKLHKRIKLVI